MSRYQRDKGARGEREAADAVRPAWPDACRRASGEESQEDRGRDLKNTPGFCFQVHVGKSATAERKLLEAIEASVPGEIPAALVRRDRSGWTVTLRLGDFLGLVLAVRDANTTPEGPAITDGGPGRPAAS